jgi:putative ABC transport system substrate-binding protein
MRHEATGNSKTEKVLGFMLSALLVALSISAEAQPRRMPRIGYLIAVSPSASANRVQAFLDGLRELGYTDGTNLVIDYRYAEEKLDRLPTLAAELVSLKPDIILTAGSQATRAAKEATSTIPIVMTNDPDPVGSGFVASLARPGGNITGLSTLAPELTGKRLELLGEIVPKLSRVAILGTSTQPGHTQAIKELELTAKAFNVQMQYFDVLGSKDIETAFHAAARGRADGVLTLTSPLLRSQRAQLADLAVKSRMPAIYNDIQFVEAGGLIFYGVSFSTLDRRAAYYVDRILKGAKPASLPVEQPTKFELVINLKTAKQIGLTIPQTVLYKADRVIK